MGQGQVLTILCLPTALWSLSTNSGTRCISSLLTSITRFTRLLEAAVELWGDKILDAEFDVRIFWQDNRSLQEQVK